MIKIISKESYSPASIFWPNLIKLNKLTEWSLEKIIRTYQGFEGDEVTFIGAFDEMNADTLNRKLQANADLVSRSLLCLISENNHHYKPLNDHGVFVGCDVGICEKEKTVYSSIFNEILFGNLAPLIEWKNLLNKNLLFPDKITAKKYVGLHDELSAQGESVEDYEAMIVYEVWKLS